MTTYTIRAVSPAGEQQGLAESGHSVDALCDALAEGTTRLEVKPHRPELTEADGRARWPLPLHPQCFADAWRGWHERDAQGVAV